MRSDSVVCEGKKSVEDGKIDLGFSINYSYWAMFGKNFKKNLKNIFSHYFHIVDFFFLFCLMEYTASAYLEWDKIIIHNLAKKIGLIVNTSHMS